MTEHVYCGQCSAKNSTSNKFCRQCGNILDTSPLNDLELSVQKDFENYQNDPDTWKWVKELINDKDLGEWIEVISTHFEAKLLPRLRGSKESLVDIFISQFIWGQESGYRHGITTDRIYHVTYGKMGTGYFCVTNQNVYIFTFSSLAKRYPVREEPGLITRVFLGTISGMLGERDELEHSRNDHNWTIPVQLISDVQIIQPKNSVECLNLITNAMTWNIYAGETERLAHAQTAIIMAKEKRLLFSDEQGQRQSDFECQEELPKPQKFKTIKPTLLTFDESQRIRRRSLNSAQIDETRANRGSSFTNLNRLALNIHQNGVKETLHDLYHASRLDTKNDVLRILYQNFQANAHHFSRYTNQKDIIASLHARLSHIASLSDSIQELETNFPQHILQPWQTLPDLAHSNLLVSFYVEDEVLDYDFAADGESIFVLVRRHNQEPGRYLVQYSLVTGQPLVSKRVSTEEGLTIAEIAVSPIGNMVVTTDPDKLAVWKLPDLEEHVAIAKSIQPGSAVKFTPDGTRIACFMPTLSFIDSSNGEMFCQMQVHARDASQGFEIGPTGKWVLTRGLGEPIRIWDTLTGEEMASFGKSIDSWKNALSPEGSHVASNLHSSVRIHNTQTGELEKVLHFSKDIIDVAYGQDRHHILAKDGDGSLHVRWQDLEKDFLELPIEPGRFRVHPTGNKIASMVGIRPSESQQRIQLWDVLHKEENKPISRFEAINNNQGWRGPRIERCETDIIGQYVGYINEENCLLWDVVSETRIQHASFVEAWIKIADIIFSPNGQLLAVYGEPPNSQENGLMILNAHDGQLIHTLPHALGFSSQKLAFSSDSQFLVALTDGGTNLRIWHTENFTEVKSIVLGTKTYHIARVANNQIIALSRSALVLFDIPSLAQKSVINLDTSNYYDHRSRYALTKPLAVNLNEDTVCILERRGRAMLMDVVSGTLINERRIYANVEGRACVFSGDGNWLATVGLDGMLRVWDSMIQNCVASFHVDDILNDCAFFPDSHRLVAAGDKGLYWFTLT